MKGGGEINGNMCAELSKLNREEEGEEGEEGEGEVPFRGDPGGVLSGGTSCPSLRGERGGDCGGEGGGVRRGGVETAEGEGDRSMLPTMLGGERKPSEERERISVEVEMVGGGGEAGEGLLERLPLFRLGPFSTGIPMVLLGLPNNK
jgi:hypothetical protein